MARKKLESVPKQRRTVNKHIELLPAASEPPATSEAITPEVEPASEPLFPLGDQPRIGNLGTVDPAAPWPLKGSVPVDGETDLESSQESAFSEDSSLDTAGGHAATETWPAPLKPAKSSKRGKKDSAGTPGTLASALLTGTGKLPAGSYLESPVAAAAPVEAEPEAPAPVTGFLGRYTDQEVIEEFQKRGLVPEGLATIPAMVAEMVKRLSFIPMLDPADEIPEIPEDSLLKTALLLKLQGEHDALMRLAGHRMGIIRTLKRDLKVGRKGRGPSENQKDLTRKAWEIAREKAKVSGLKAQAHMREAWAELKAN